jgi:hypothetical protein
MPRMHAPIFLLSFNAALQVLVSSLLGVFMLIPMQPWGKRWLPYVNMKSLLATHLDWYTLAFMQWGAAFMMWRRPALSQLWVAGLLVFGGWVNPLPYLLRGFGVMPLSWETTRCSAWPQVWPV